MRVRDLPNFVKAALLWPSVWMGVWVGLSPGMAAAHVSEQGFVLLLPTETYRAAGVAVVALTVLLLTARPGAVGLRHRPLRALHMPGFAMVTSLMSLGFLIGLIWIGLAGPRDPLSNLMPLGFWTLGWVGLVSLTGLAGSSWSWINPWTGLMRLAGLRRLLRWPRSLGLWPATLLLIAFSAFLLADIAPDDPARLARLLGLYWLAVFVGCVVFGPAWLRSVELGHAILRAYGQLSALRLRGPAGLGAPGWQITTRPQPAGAGAFALALLALGSFDGLNETFWWLGLIGVNPLEFPGRSAVIWPTLGGIVAALALLWLAFGLNVWLGLRLSRLATPMKQAFQSLALSLLPIALAYHIAHYLPSFLVSIQYTLAAIGDPLAAGQNLFGLGQIRVTTGFFNRLDTVRWIWLSQAGCVVLGHVWSVLLSHRIALRLSGEARQTLWLTLPLSLFMIAYTFLGLWLLAAPRGA